MDNHPNIFVNATPVLNILRPSTGIELSRIGSNSDGGYLISREVKERATNLISLGYGFNSKLERDFAKIKNARVILFDDVSRWSFYFLEVIAKLIRHSLKQLVTGNWSKLWVSSWNAPLKDWIYLQLSKNLTYFNFRVVASKQSETEIDFREILETHLIKSPFVNLIKIDIEGGEYEILSIIKDYSIYISGLIIEFHDIESHEADISQFMNQIKRDFQIDHLHVNNFRQPINGKISTVEVSLTNTHLRNESSSPRNTSFHSLDTPNTRILPSIFVQF